MRSRFILHIVGLFVLWVELLSSSSSTHVRDFCSYSRDPGPCRDSQRRFFYNSTSRKCEMFHYGGCLGNLNRFLSLGECQRSCGKMEKPGFCLPSPQGILAECSTACVHDGNCPGAQKCCSYGCALRCFDPVEDLCRLPPETGPCSNLIPRWFYSWPLKRCEKFTYGGCAGNKNNFRTHKGCQGRCAPRAATDAHKTSSTVATDCS